jgi:UDP-MurNAc hydroxylase
MIDATTTREQTLSSTVAVASSSADPPTITWINHASFMLELGDVRLVTDPWLSGSVFNRACRHTSPTRFSYSDFANVTHIWFSHQHPDHFFPPDLRKIDPDLRKQIAVMYHRTIDKKVIRFCKGLGFHPQVEMVERCWYPLSPSVALSCGIWFERDSWLAIRTPHGTILNINDCVVDSPRLARDIARAVGPVRVLMNQFSYASWEPDADARAEAAREHLQRMAMHARVFKPEFMVPMGSYIYFCNADNFFMNDGMNRVGDVARFIEEQGLCRPVVMYPGERWRMGDPHDWRPAAARYAADWDSCMAGGPTEEPRSVSIERLKEGTRTLLTRIRTRNPFAWLYPQTTTTVSLADLGRTVTLTPNGLDLAANGSVADIEMSSDSLYNCLKAPWGADALSAAGRFKNGPNDGRKRFFRYFKLADWNDHGYVLAMHRLVVLLCFRARQIRRRIHRSVDAYFNKPVAHQR